jgi:FkbM family methyltransferase
MRPETSTNEASPHSALRECYRRVFKKLHGKGLGLGLFNRLHALIWQRFLRPKSVDIHGLRMVLPPDDTGFSQVLDMGDIFEPEMVGAFERAVAPGMTVLDVGANVGYYTLLASRLVGESGKVLAFEPERTNLSFLLRNIAGNSCSNVLVCPYAVSSGAGTAVLHLTRPSRSGHSLVVRHKEREAGGEQTIATVGLDDFLPREFIPDVVKMDIEGAEPLALKGMTRILSDPKLKVVFIECNRDMLAAQGTSPEEVLGTLRDRGFSCLRLDEANFLCTRTAPG